MNVYRFILEPGWGQLAALSWGGSPAQSGCVSSKIPGERVPARGGGDVPGRGAPLEQRSALPRSSAHADGDCWIGAYCVAARAPPVSQPTPSRGSSCCASTSGRQRQCRVRLRRSYCDARLETVRTHRCHHRVRCGPPPHLPLSRSRVGPNPVAHAERQHLRSGSRGGVRRGRWGLQKGLRCPLRHRGQGGL